jgi:hypothetical protein
MSKERELIKDMKILLECTDMGSLQRNADVLIGRAIELLAQPEQEQEPVAWMLIDKETGARIPKAYKPKHGVNKDRWELYPLHTTLPKREPLSDEAICDILIKKEWRGFVDLVRIIEKAHGIGVGDEN